MSEAYDAAVEIREPLMNILEMLDTGLPDRRERIATACLAGLLACSETKADVPVFAKEAVLYADALITALDAPAKAK